MASKSVTAATTLREDWLQSFIERRGRSLRAGDCLEESKQRDRLQYTTKPDRHRRIPPRSNEQMGRLTERLKIYLVYSVVERKLPATRREGN